MRVLSAIAVCTLASACMTGPVSEAELEVSARRESLVDGVEVTTNPEIGHMWTDFGGPCTGTLIGRRAILTAAHCFGYTSKPDGGDSGWAFIFKNGEAWREIQGYISLGDGANPDSDIAVAKLNNEVDPVRDGVFWADVALNFPTDPNQTVRWFGFGCGDFILDSLGQPLCTAQSNFEVKRMHEVFWFGLTDHKLATDEIGNGRLTLAVSGDSGGPVLSGSSIILLTSDTVITLDETKTVAVRGVDRFADVPRNFQRIQSAIQRLGLSTL